MSSKITGMHKDQYYSTSTIHEKSREIIAYVRSMTGRHEAISFYRKNAALLVLDLQEYFFKEDSHAYIPSAPAILPGVAKLIAASAKADLPVIVTKHMNTVQDAGMMSRWWRDLIESESAYSQLVKAAETHNSILIKKTQYDAFYSTELESLLRDRGVEQVVICGVMTHLCCETTARSAFVRGFEVFFAVDGTATYNEQLHRASLLTLGHGFAVPVLIDDLLRQLVADET